MSLTFIPTKSHILAMIRSFRLWGKLDSYLPAIKRDKKMRRVWSTMGSHDASWFNALLFFGLHSSFRGEWFRTIIFP